MTKELDEYDAIAIIEWDVVVAHESSFKRLHEAAFDNSEPFWIKGSILAGDFDDKWEPRDANDLQILALVMQSCG